MGFDQVRFLNYTAERKLMVVPEEDPTQVVGLFARGLHVATASRPVDPEFDTRRNKQQYELRVKRLDVDFDARLKGLFDTATEKKLWRGTAAARDRVEYWAAGVEAYFDAGAVGPAPQGADHPILTREQLKGYDAELFKLVEETMAYRGKPDWRVKR
jgi:hypothetical protein